jgi:hypothetical protein
MSPEEQQEWLEAAKVNLRLVYGKGRPATGPNASEQSSQQPDNDAEE